MSLLFELTRLRGEHEKDEARAVQWVKEATGEDIMEVWTAIQELGGTDVKELISRFAQVGMSHAFLLAHKK